MEEEVPGPTVGDFVVYDGANGWISVDVAFPRFWKKSCVMTLGHDDEREQRRLPWMIKGFAMFSHALQFLLKHGLVLAFGDPVSVDQDVIWVVAVMMILPNIEAGFKHQVRFGHHFLLRVKHFLFFRLLAVKFLKIL